jgi:GNAT superfamily N-acetyltransferase
MGWVPDEQHARFFAWKHRANPHGESPSWVAVDGDRVVGFRTFLRWRFRQDGDHVAGVRAVDTATHPDYRGRGIFSELTMHALDALAEEGVAFVYNTPNEASLPGYLKMGWQRVGRLPVLSRPRSPRALLRLARARTPAERWSLESTAGVPAADALDRDDRIGTLAERPTTTPASGATDVARIQTARSVEHLRWRYGFAPLGYRAVLVSDDPDDGLAIFRLRRRGAATEAAVCEMLLPGGDATLHRRLVTRIVRESGADHAVLLGRAGSARRPASALGEGLLQVPGQGPVLVWRAVRQTAPPPAHAWDLQLGDIELF